MKPIKQLKNMKRYLALLLLLLTLPAYAQDRIDPVIAAHYRENIFRTAVNMDPYEYIPGVRTAPPKGYKPFYISHYGRHGSRSNWGGSYDRILATYERAAQEGILTAEGTAALEQIREAIRLHNHMDGRLTPLGQLEHEQIAERMYREYKRVFTSKNRKIRAISSTTPRCIISMNASTGRLLALRNDLEFEWDTGETLQKYISSDHTREMRDSIHRITAALDRRHVPDTAAFLRRIFTDPVRGRALTGDPVGLMRDTYNMATTCPAFELDDRLFRLFSEEELYWYAQSLGTNFYLGQCNSVEFGDIRMPRAQPLITDIVTKADEVINGGEYCADLRYGHDYQVLALSSLLGLEGVAERRDKDGALNWEGWRYTPFGANVQIIFYRRRSGGDVLVKFLLNERETRVIGLEGGPYYKWDDVKRYLGR